MRLDRLLKFRCVQFGFGLASSVRTLFKPWPLVMGLVVSSFIDAVAADFIAGADLSHLAYFEQLGVVYKDAGQVEDALSLVKQRGLTCVRLRLFTSSAAQAQADPYDYINNLDYTVPLARRVKAAGLKFMLDFHYSDTWADPGHQRKPAAWTSLTFTQLVQQMHDYNSNVLAAFQAVAALPDYVQIGNEITGGILWPDGQVGGTNNTPAQWAQLGQLLGAAVQGINDACGPQMPKLIVHIDRGGDWAGTQWFFDNLAQQHVSFDIIGESYYPFWQGPLGSLANCLTNAAQRYGKPVVIAETAFPWTNSVWGTNIVGLNPSATNQVVFLAELAAVENTMPTGLAAGIIWWGAEYQHASGVNEAGFDSASFFDANGSILPIAEAFGSLVQPRTLSAARQDDTLTLSWPLSAAGAFPAANTNLLPLAPWLRITNTIQTNQTGFQITLPIGPGPCRFYRLQPN